MRSKQLLLLNYTPVFGIVAFITFFIVSTNLYQGGSLKYLHSKGFDWINNYWCNLLNYRSMNGELNPARTYAIGGMLILCLSLIAFFIQFAITFATDRFWKFTIITSGTFCMLATILLFTSYHDLMTTIASIFGLVTIIGIVKEMSRINLTAYKLLGILCLALLLINNLIYYSEYNIRWLPLIQKLTFAPVFSWIIGINYDIRKLILTNKRKNHFY